MTNMKSFQLAHETPMIDDEIALRDSQTADSPLRTWLQFISYITSGRQRNNYTYHEAPTDDSLGEDWKALSQRSRRPYRSKWVSRIRKVLWSSSIIALCFFGLLHITLALLGRRRLFFDSASYAANLPQWRKPASIDPALLEYPTDATRDIQPIPCMSHNDEWRSVPLFEALHYGCTGVEADVWQVDGEDELFVGHSQTALTRNRTFRSLYLNPLEELLDSMNPDTGPSDPSRHGVFDVDPEQTLVLLVDFKTDGEALFPLVSSQLETLRRKNYLTYWDGFAMHSRALTVVGTGNAPFNLIIANQTYRDIFFDAPLDLLWEPEEGDATSTPPLPHHPSLFGGSGQGNTGIEHITSPADFNATNSYYASLSFTSSIGFPWTGRLTASQLALIRGQIRGAKRRGLKARYWSTPDWPTSLRNYIWETVMLEGAEVLNVDDLRSAAALDWRDGVGHYLLDA